MFEQATGIACSRGEQDGVQHVLALDDAHEKQLRVGEGSYACLGWVHGSNGAASVDHALLLEEGSASSTRLLLRSLLPHQQSQQSTTCHVLSLKTGSGKRCSRRDPSAPLEVPAFPHSSISGILA